MRNKYLILLTTALLMTAGGCDVFEDDDDEVALPGPGPDPDPDPDPPPTGDTFNAFVIDLVQNDTADDSDPVEINDLDFEFDEDPAAFDELFDTAP